MTIKLLLLLALISAIGVGSHIAELIKLPRRQAES
jgi:hypothetical protein